MVKIERSFPAHQSLAEEAQKTTGKYDKPDVIQQLRKDFHNKCYICEMKDLQDPNVEHLIPHKNGKNIEMKFDWENLFWACGHCNGIKNNGKYDKGIIDCCKIDPERIMVFLVAEDGVNVKEKDIDDECAKRTALLVTESFSLKNTGMRTYTSAERMRLLQIEMSKLYKQLEKLHANPEQKVTKRVLGSLLRRESAFAAFKRCYVRMHASEYPELQEYVTI